LLLTLAAAADADQPAPADTMVVDLPDLVVAGDAAVAVDAGRTILGAPILGPLDAASVADVTVALPSTRAAANSRGDAHPMVRGAPERHVQTFLDGIPLNIPWDERVDLETIPAVAVGSVAGRRGPTSLLEGPGALAGSLRLLPPTLAGERPTTDVRAAAGEHGLGRVELAHQRPAGSWNLLGAGSYRTRDAWPLPEGGDLRQNSDLEQGSLLLRASRPVSGTGRLSLLTSAWTGEKGVPPELHLGDDARFWRYPVRERALLGAVLVLPLDDRDRWDLGATASLDYYHQEIDPRGPDGWGAPLEQGQAYEKNWDRTGYGRLRLSHWISDDAAVALQASARYTNHREITEVGGPELTYSQWLTSVVLEGDWRLGTRWDLRAGLGWDHVATPETGDKPDAGPDDAGSFNLRLSYELAPGRGLYAAAGRGSRFPSLREAYSGALGRFVPNPDLGPEQQDQVEVGGRYEAGRVNLQAAVFYGKLTDGIERVAVSPTQFQRVNRSEITVPGAEVVGAWQPAGDLELSVQYTVLDARVQDDGTERPAEDRPQYLSRVALGWQPWAGPQGLLEARVTGPRWSADGTDPSGLRYLPAGVTWHLRVGWRWPTEHGELAAHLRLDNVFDQRVDWQTGLPEPGRVLSGGLGWTF
jgi:iron complex outermembrane receptor protein